MAENEEMKNGAEEAVEEAADSIFAGAADEVDVEEAEDAAESVEGAEAASMEETYQAALQEKEDRIMRLQADFDNFRRRTAKEKEELAAVVTQGLFTDMLPMLDNFERAMAAEGEDTENFKKGVEMIFTQLNEILKNNGLEVINTKDAKFDPNFHQAVMRVQNPDLEDDTIVMELQKGYMVKDRVIRPSMVQVVSN